MSAPLFKKVDAGDYITYKKRIAIAGEYAHVTPTNPVKTNGKQYNQNYTFVPIKPEPTVDISNCLLNAQNYELLKDYTNGVSYLRVVCE